MSAEYNPLAIEQSLQQEWQNQNTYKTTENMEQESFYCLSMFPYPSGKLHMGHVRNYTLGDIIARYQRMQGKNVLQPIGWDAFGLPAENAAIQSGKSPAKWTYHNIEVMKTQFKSLGFAYDWSREFATCQPDYYRWEQWLFLKLYEKGLVYRKSSMVNWDPVDNTVLANEQVVDGKGWRSGATVERREIPQWFLKITHYADELLDNLDHMDGWPERVRSMQRNWIGKSKGVSFDIPNNTDHTLRVYTTRPDTLYGMTFIAVSSEHPIAIEVGKSDPKIKAFLHECNSVSVAEGDQAKLEKKGMLLDIEAKHPITGKPIPLYVANYVLATYGSGAVMAVPAHDERDYEFAKKYDIPIIQVIESNDTHDINRSAWTEEGHLIASDEFNGIYSLDAIQAITERLCEKANGTVETKYRLHDWGISRQRYWGAPIPFIYCDNCGVVPEKEENLPVTLPENVDFKDGYKALKDMPEFYKTACPTCGESAKRETDTFDTFMESSWYYARFACPDEDKAMLDARAKYWTPVDQYVGGIEHAVMHLLYARFIHRCLRDIGLLNSDEPFTKLLTQGMVLKDGAKMSKSKGNVVDPEALIEKFGADTVRVFMAFTAPPDQSLEWSDSGVEGAFRFLRKLYQSCQANKSVIQSQNELSLSKGDIKAQWENGPESLKNARRELHTLLKQANFDYERQQYNTVVSSCMKMANLLNSIAQEDQSSHLSLLLMEATDILLHLLCPIAPHVCHYLWKTLGYSDSIEDSLWPTPSTSAMVTDSIAYVVQVNGKLRSKISVPAHAEKEAIETAAIEDEIIQKYLENKAIKKVIVVPNKLVNIVVA